MKKLMFFMTLLFFIGCGKVSYIKETEGCKTIGTLMPLTQYPKNKKGEALVYSLEVQTAWNEKGNYQSALMLQNEIVSNILKEMSTYKLISNEFVRLTNPTNITGTIVFKDKLAHRLVMSFFKDSDHEIK